jgi:hypothetical protein
MTKFAIDDRFDDVDIHLCESACKIDPLSRGIGVQF